MENQTKLKLAGIVTASFLAGAGVTKLVDALFPGNPVRAVSLNINSQKINVTLEEDLRGKYTYLSFEPSFEGYNSGIVERAKEKSIQFYNLKSVKKQE